MLPKIEEAELIEHLLDFIRFLARENSKRQYLNEQEFAQALGYKNKQGLDSLLKNESRPQFDKLICAQRLYERMFQHQISLDEILGLGVWRAKQNRYTHSSIVSLIQPTKTYTNPANPDEQHENDLARGIEVYKSIVVRSETATSPISYPSADVIKMLIALREGRITLESVECWGDNDDRKKTSAFQKFCETFNLESQYVHVPITSGLTGQLSGLLAGEIVAFTAATRIMPTLDAHNIGLGSGGTILRFIEHTRLYPRLSLPPSSPHFVSLTAEMPQKEGITNHPANSLVATAKNRFPNSNYTRVPNHTQKIDETIWHDLDVAFVGVTALGKLLQEFLAYGEYTPLLLKRIQKYFEDAKNSNEPYAVALFLHFPLAANGKEVPLSSEDRDKLAGIPMDILTQMRERQKKVYLLAGGDAKKQAVLAALKTGCISGLVVDDGIMTYLLEQAP